MFASRLNRPKQLQVTGMPKLLIDMDRKSANASQRSSVEVPTWHDVDPPRTFDSPADLNQLLTVDLPEALVNAEAKAGAVDMTIKRLVCDKANNTIRKVFVAASAIPDPKYRKKIVASLTNQFKASAAQARDEVAFWLKCWDAFTALNGEATLDVKALKTKIKELVRLSTPPKDSGYIKAKTLEDAKKKANAKTRTANVAGPDQTLISDVAKELKAFKKLQSNKDQDGARIVRGTMAENLLTVIDSLGAFQKPVGDAWFDFTFKLKET